MQTEYEINKGTYMIVSEGKTSKVYDEDGIYDVELSTVKLLDDNCKNYGSTLKGRKEGTEALTGIKYKTPIIISELNKIIFFPTASSRNNDCNWISVNNIKDYYKNGKKTIIVFSNGLECEIDASYYVIENQVLKSALLESKLYKNEKKK